ncbi:MAG: hypothetical protein EHJ95_01430 [Methanobacteriota archaeon]|nr:MAG: hypothetical protein EHJ95_01430 [Euryarchaeota archaeon]
MERWQRLILLIVGCLIPIVFVNVRFIWNNVQYGVAVMGSFPGYEVVHLTDEDLADHPALVDLIKNRKKVLRTGVLNYFVGHVTKPGTYSNMPFSPDEEAIFFTRNLEYNGSNFVVAVTM